MALAGDHYPDLGCNGPAWRDVNGDGEAGFDPECRPDPDPRRAPGAHRPRQPGRRRCVRQHPHQLAHRRRGVYRDRRHRDLLHRRDAVGRRRQRHLARRGPGRRRGSARAVATYDREDRGIEAAQLLRGRPPLVEPTPRAAGPGASRDARRSSCRPSWPRSARSRCARSTICWPSPAGQDAVAAGSSTASPATSRSASSAAASALAGRAGRRGSGAVPGDGPLFWAPHVPRWPGCELRAHQHRARSMARRDAAAWPAGRHRTSPYLAAAPARWRRSMSPLPRWARASRSSWSVALPEPPARAALAWISLSDGGDDAGRSRVAAAPARQRGALNRCGPHRTACSVGTTWPAVSGCRLRGRCYHAALRSAIGRRGAISQSDRRRRRAAASTDPCKRSRLPIA